MDRKLIGMAALAACMAWAGPASAQMASAQMAAQLQLADGDVSRISPSSGADEAAPAEPPKEEPKAEEAPQRDPFQPYGAATTGTGIVASSEEGVEARQTLASIPLDSFRLVGIIIAPDISLAAVQTRDFKDYIIATGDSIGKEGGVVDAIRRDGMTVKVGEDKIDIPVSNKVEKVNAKNKK